MAGLLKHRGVNSIPRGDHNLRIRMPWMSSRIPRLWLPDEYLHRVLNSILPIPTGKIRIENNARNAMHGVKGEAGSPSNTGYGQADAWITSHAQEGELFISFKL